MQTTWTPFIGRLFTIHIFIADGILLHQKYEIYSFLVIYYRNSEIV